VAARPVGLLREGRRGAGGAGPVCRSAAGYRDSLGITERLAAVDPSNPEWQRDLSILYGKVGDVLMVQSKLDEALKAYRDSLAIRERLAVAGPSNPEWQRDLAVSYSKIGSVYLRLDKPADALTALRRGRDIIAELVSIARNNTEWKKELDWFDGQIAEAEAQSQEAGKH
jgi:tetratricopeptide (TPR) repeat protein